MFYLHEGFSIINLTTPPKNKMLGAFGVIHAWNSANLIQKALNSLKQ